MTSLSSEKIEQAGDDNGLVEAVINNSPHAMIVFNCTMNTIGQISDLEWILQNKKAEEISGIKNPETHGKSLLKILNERNKKSSFDSLVEMIATIEPGACITLENFWTDGDIFDVTFTKFNKGIVVSFKETPNKENSNDGHQLQHIASNGQKSEKNKSHTERLGINDLLRQLPAGIAVLSGPDHIYEMANDLYYDIVGKTELIGLPGRKAMPDIVNLGLWDIVDNVYKTGEKFVANEFPVFQDKKGNGNIDQCYYNFHFNPVFDDYKEVEGIIILAIDVTEQVNMRNQVQDSGEQFRFLANNIPVAIWKASPEGDIVFFNQYWYDYTGLGHEQSKKWRWTEMIHPEDHDEYIASWKRSIETMEPFEHEARLKMHDDGYRWHLSRASAMKDNKGDVIMWIGSHSDIHDQKESSEILELAIKTRTEELSEAISDLSRSNNDLEQFAYVASHDLKEPIRMVSNYATLLAKRYTGKLDADLDEFIGYITEGARRMQELIDDLLSYSRIGHTDNVSLVDCNNVMAIVKENLLDKIENAGAIIEYPELPVIPGKESQLIRLFQNLIENSLKFHSADNTPTIKIACKKAGNHWQFSFSDNGIGIDPMYENKIFVIFQRLHTRDKYPGTGIGLAVCKKIVELHGGKIWVESKLGSGATFFFTLLAG
jgi:PAS domain S-box-containing protein